MPLEISSSTGSTIEVTPLYGPGIGPTIILASQDAGGAIAARAAAEEARLSAVAALASEVAAEADKVQTGLDRVQTGQDRAQASLDASATAADRVQTGQDRAATAADRVRTGQDSSTASSAATVATTQAGIAVNQAQAADASAGLAADSADTAVGAAEVAVGRATIATQKASEASSSAGAAATSASTAGTHAQTATTQAGTATTKAGEASTSAASALSSKNSATASATTATTKAGEASASASSASSSAQSATTSAATATTKASEASGSAATATTKASEASGSAQTAATQAGIATTKAGEASASATAAHNSQVAAAASADAAQAVLEYPDLALIADSIEVLNASEAIQTVAANITDVQNAEENALTAATQAGNALASALTAQAAASNVVAVVTGGTASLTSSAGKIPIADASGKIDPAYVDLLAGGLFPLHRSPNAPQVMFIYDTSKDSDGGAWTERCQHTSWYQGTLNGKWLGAHSSELSARCFNAVLGTETVTNGAFATDLTGWMASAGASSVSGALNLVTSSSLDVTCRQTLTTVASTNYVLTFAKVSGPGTPTDLSIIVGTSDGGSQLLNLASIGAYAAGTYSFTFAATSTTSFLRFTNSTNTAATAIVDSVSVKPVATQASATGDYFQLASDGKFYSLAAESGTNEVFRGSKRAFPKLSAIVASASNVDVYDLTEAGRPIWARYPNSEAMAIGNIAALSAINGRIFVGGASGLATLNFATDRMMLRNAKNLSAQAGLATLRTATRSIEAGTALTNDAIADIAITVMPNAPAHPATGLRVPTIALATGARVVVIHNDGTLVNSSNTSAFTQVTLTPQLLSAGRADAVWYYAANPGSLGASFVLSTKNASTATDFNAGNTTLLKAKDRANYARTSGAFVQLLRNNEGAVGKGIAAKLSDTYNTGWLAGDIRRAYLASNYAGNVVPTTELVTNGTFDTDTSGWTPLGGAILTVEGQRLKVQNGIAQSGRASQSMPTIPGRRYTLSGYGEDIDGIPTVRAGTTEQGINLIPITAAIGNFSIDFTATSEIVYITVYNNRPVQGVAVLFDNISVKEFIKDRSYKAAAANITGPLTATAVNTGNDLVAYSGFSAANYIQEPYSADLDFGTGEWSVSAWVNIPASLPLANFPVVGSNLVANGTFDVDVSGWAPFAGEATITWVDGVAQIAGTHKTSPCGYTQTFTLVVGKSYKATARMRWVSGAGTATGLRVTSSGGGVVYAATNFVTSSEWVTVEATFTATTITNKIFLSTTNDTTFQVDDVTLTEISPILIADRAAATGPRIALGVGGGGEIVAVAGDGTTTRTVTTIAQPLDAAPTPAYNTATWVKVRANYTTDGKLAILINGLEVASATGAPLLTLDNSNAVLTIGNSYALNAPFPGSLALLKFSATVPSVEQATFMFEQEKHLFTVGAKCVLPASTPVLDMAYDEETDTWSALQATRESTWSGLVRTGMQTPSAGSFSKVASGSGNKMLARTTTNPGVDIQMPSRVLRTELRRRREVLTMNQDVVTFDYFGGFTATTTLNSTALTSVAASLYPNATNLIGCAISGAGIPAGTVITSISGTTIYMSKAATASGSSIQISTTDFNIPTGHIARAVTTAGAFKREGSLADYTRLFDGFRETVRFAVAPGFNAWVQIQAVRELAQ